MASYKKEYPYLVEDIVTECDIYSAEGHKFHTERAMWDTGANTTIISSRIVNELKLQPYKQGGIAGIGGVQQALMFTLSTCSFQLVIL